MTFEDAVEVIPFYEKYRFEGGIKIVDTFLARQVSDKDMLDCMKHIFVSHRNGALTPLSASPNDVVYSTHATEPHLQPRKGIRGMHRIARGNITGRRSANCHFCQTLDRSCPNSSRGPSSLGTCIGSSLEMLASPIRITLWPAVARWIHDDIQVASSTL